MAWQSRLQPTVATSTMEAEYMDCVDTRGDDRAWAQRLPAQ